MKLGLIGLTLLLVVSLSGGAAAQVDPCASGVALAGPGPFCFPACPRGDSLTPLNFGWFIRIVLVDAGGSVIPGILPSDIWLEDCDPVNTPIIPCLGGQGASSADSATGANGQTTMSLRPFAASGCGGAGSAIDPGDAVRVFVQGTALQNPAAGCTDLCLPVEVRSLDLVSNGILDLPDLSLFAQAFRGTIPGECSDFTCDGVVGLSDFAIFAIHYQAAHACP